MLFIPFIENSFKHSKIEDLENGWMKIQLKSRPDYLHFSVRNSVPDRIYTKDEVGGIGINNVRRRLKLLYPDQHELIIDQKDIQFSVSLTLELK